MARYDEWDLGKVEHHGKCSITKQMGVGRGHYQVRCAGKGHVGNAKTIARARGIAKQANAGLAGTRRRRRR